MSHTLNLIAYTSQFIGTGIIFKFGVPTVTDTGGKMSLLLEQEDEEEKKKIKNYKYLGMLVQAQSSYTTDNNGNSYTTQTYGNQSYTTDNNGNSWSTQTYGNQSYTTDNNGNSWTTQSY